ncbi:pentatricopeptide repeat-containing protein At3g22690 [Brachypodium distachyon]|uniref:Pentacotripeptide-repeat region of PRORP domain-containing protein n=1 Tax=Brachypodium distachyon TaxID=15368 RepID=A0A0Q3R6B5_BRADI|nr:pentatricopeptide repeat-containing protein At3g22690 [Brachypodium distachyon]KQK08962.1 hypothetical protein BRADI_2g45110v3 [Brachypodium distachyon]PNT72492.1 hypothetical protein BRADI_2g45110v3 [Brachypodium distachyon]PNT72493.1 hypothetical protein BRADI_2g45110v3 [Brachypodium distachyon]PNT72494.1 hypothetical protein BRADI_2g45110v3 [Brachypodium distachyon]|eukprot:XP_003566938.1 pentatricopeptide repeat-containing protein At3g22690 [Brachypodium distachyon]
MRYLYFRPNTTSRARACRDSLLAHLDACASRANLAELHGRLVRAHLGSDPCVAGRLVTLLASPVSRHDMPYARKVFDRMAQPTAIVWNCMIRGYNSCHAPMDALELFRAMRRSGVSPDNYTMAAVAQSSAAFASWKGRATGDAVHALVQRIGFASDLFVMSGLINFYGASKSVEDARKVFEEMHERDVVSWTLMISAFAQCGQWDNVLRSLDEMQSEGTKPNKITIISLLSACGQVRAVDKGLWVYARVDEYGIEADVDIRNALIGMYVKCGCMSDAWKTFKGMPIRNTKSWNTLIDGFVQNGKHKEALTMFEEMLSDGVIPDVITLVSVLSTYAQLGDLQQGRYLHNYIKDHEIHCDIILQNSLINMYAKCGDMAAAEIIFENMARRDIVSWTAMVCGYVKGLQFRTAFNLFDDMKVRDVMASEMALVSLLSACSQLGALDKGREIHSYIKEKSVRTDMWLESALVDMYAKCGCIDAAAEIFSRMRHKQTLAWNAMIGGLASQGQGKEAVALFEQLLKLRDPKPDAITLKVVLCACTHVGMVDEGLHYFNLMLTLGIVPDNEHYGCIVDLLGRAGLLDEAYNFIQKMPIQPNPVIWGSLLAACRVHHRMELGKIIGQHIIDLAPNDVGAHVLISNLHAEEGQWDDVEQVRGMMGSRRVEKSPGHSSIQV